MKKFYVLLFLAITTLLAGCNQIDPGQVTDDEDCVVSLKFGGEITVSESPLTKVSSDDLYLVQIYRGTSAFAFGFFDQTDIRFNLKKGTDKYRIIVSTIKNGKAAFATNYSSVNNSIHPEETCDSFYPANLGSYYIAINFPYYNSVKTIRYYSDNNSTELKTTSRSNVYLSNIEFATAYRGDHDYYLACYDWFYGEINDYSPTGEYETLNMDLKRVGFKLKYELSGVTDGEVTVKVYNDKKTFIDNTTSTATYSSEPQFFAFYEVRNAWLYADDYMENMTLSVSWLRGIGVTEDYGTKTIQIKRNCLNNIKISLGSNDQSAGMNLTVESENTIGADGIIIPVQ